MSNERELVEHPSWCDPHACTAPKYRPTLEEYKGAAVISGRHQSGAVLAYNGRGDLAMSLQQAVCPWDTDVYLSFAMGDEGMGAIPVSMGGGGMALFELLAEEIGAATRRYPALYGERFGYVADATSSSDEAAETPDVGDDESDEATADVVMPRDPVELEEQMAITNPDEPSRKYEFAGCGGCGTPDTCAPAQRCWAGRPDAWISKEPGVSYRLIVNAKDVAEGTLQDVTRAVADLLTVRLGAAPERVAVDAQTVNMAFNTGAVQEQLDTRGDWYTVVDAYGEEPLRIRITKEE